MKPIDMNTNRLAWIDIETTGLNPSTGRILEVAIAITDRSLKIVALHDWQVHYTREAFERARHDQDHPLWMPPEVLEMHTASGLIADCIASDLGHAEVETAAIRLIDRFDARLSPMCGSSVHFDRSWLAVHMPTLHDCFHYRNFDASMYRIEGELAGRADIPAKPTNGHRALVDVSNSIDLARWGMRDGQRWRRLLEVVTVANTPPNVTADFADHVVRLVTYEIP